MITFEIVKAYVLLRLHLGSELLIISGYFA